MADLTATQAMYRELEAGESRKELVRKVASGLAKRKWHTLSSQAGHRVNKAVGVAKA